MWLGEGVKKDLTGKDPNFWLFQCNPDPNAWGLLYCNRNLSNTPSALLREYRPVAWLDSEANSTAITLEPNEQIAYQLDYNGIFVVDPYSKQTAACGGNHTMNYALAIQLEMVLLMLVRQSAMPPRIVPRFQAKPL
jgi:hypothetical protein